jgi:hypothetical protein
MNRLLTLVLAAILWMPASIFAQHEHTAACGFVPTPEYIQQLKDLKQQINEGVLETRDNEITYVPLKLHLIGKADGSSRVSEMRVLDMVCTLNEEFADQDIQFYIYNGFNYINNDAAYSNPGDVPLILTGNKDNKALNIYMGANATPPNGSGLGVTLGYYSPFNDWVVVRRSEISAASSTTPHEVGHFFGLPHPFNGWDCTAWNEAEHGNPVNFTQSPCNPDIPVERANGSNCNNAGDFICDTPADYNFGFVDSNNDCNWDNNPEVYDNQGNLLQPQENNMMGYFNGCADYEFTPTQKDIMAANLNARGALDTDFTPSATSINGTPDLIAPGDFETTEAYNEVAFEWTAVDGANQYILEIDLAPNFSFAPIRMVVWGTYKVVTELQPSVTYHWRVRPYNAYATCSDVSEKFQFETGTAINTVEPTFVQDWSVQPNPVVANSMVQIEMNTNEAFDAQVELVSTSGQTLQRLDTTFPAGNSAVNLQVDNLPSGLYIVYVRTQKGVLTKRLVVTQ